MRVLGGEQAVTPLTRLLRDPQARGGRPRWARWVPSNIGGPPGTPTLPRGDELSVRTVRLAQQLESVPRGASSAPGQPLGRWRFGAGEWGAGGGGAAISAAQIGQLINACLLEGESAFPGIFFFFFSKVVAAGRKAVANGEPSAGAQKPPRGSRFHPPSLGATPSGVETTHLRLWGQVDGAPEPPGEARLRARGADRQMRPAPKRPGRRPDGEARQPRTRVQRGQRPGRPRGGLGTPIPAGASRFFQKLPARGAGGGLRLPKNRVLAGCGRELDSVRFPPPFETGEKKEAIWSRVWGEGFANVSGTRASKNGEAPGRGWGRAHGREGNRTPLGQKGEWRRGDAPKIKCWGPELTQEPAPCECLIWVRGGAGGEPPMVGAKRPLEKRAPSHVLRGHCALLPGKKDNNNVFLK